jgi:hypothetical protein
VGAGGASNSLPVVGASVLSGTLRPQHALSGRSAKIRQAETDHNVDKDQQAETVVEASAAERLSPVPTSASAPIDAQPALVDSQSRTDEPHTNPTLQALAPANALAPPPLVTAAAPVTARLLSSKRGQDQLLTNPASAASRVRLPAGLDRMGDTYSALVNICVLATGSVSKVNVLRSAGPALDPQILNALSHWRYRPLLEAGKATPFCYVLNYEISAR